jgi:hypothetical protein
MNKRTYAGQLLGYTFRRSFIVTDRAAILIGPIITAYFWLRGDPIPEGLDGLIAIGILITAGAALLLRMLSAQYVMWRRDQARIKHLKTTLDAPLRRAKEDAAQYRSDLRRELSERLASMIVFVETLQIPPFVEAVGDHRLSEKYLTDVIRAREIVSALSYDVVLRVCCLNLVKLCASIVQEIGKSGDVKALNERLWTQRKLTFRLLHHDFSSDVIALALIENLIAKHGEDFGPKRSEEDPMESLKRMLLEHPELESELELELDRTS